MARASCQSIAAFAEARLLVPLMRARGLRRRQMWGDCAGQVRSSLQMLTAEMALGEVVSCEPVRFARGGFLSAVVETADGPCFVKGVPSRSREAVFWGTWLEGAIRDEGEHYRLVPPLRIARRRVATLLAFPYVPGLSAQRSGRRRAFERNLLQVARALADFNASHRIPVERLGPGRPCGPVPVPGARQIARTLGTEPALAASLAAEAREIEGAWQSVRGAVETGERCLAHMDLGIGNILPGQGAAVLLDFGHAGMAPIGVDLHTVMRNLGRGGPGIGDCVDAYVEVFQGKGIGVETALVRRNLEAHFAARYRDLRFASARNPETYQAALSVSRSLLEAAGR